MGQRSNDGGRWRRCGEGFAPYVAAASASPPWPSPAGTECRNLKCSSKIFFRTLAMSGHEVHAEADRSDPGDLFEILERLGEVCLDVNYRQ